MDLSRIKQLRIAEEEENFDIVELSEIQAAFDQIPDDELRDKRENAMAGDMLDELESRVSPVERSIYNYVSEHYGESEANDPSWAIGPLAEHLSKEFNL